MVDCTALERRHTEIPYRGFESLSFRQISIRCCFMQHRIFYFLQNNQAITASLCLLESQQIAFALVGVLVGKYNGLNVFGGYSLCQRSSSNFPISKFAL